MSGHSWYAFGAVELSHVRRQMPVPATSIPNLKVETSKRPYCLPRTTYFYLFSRDLGKLSLFFLNTLIRSRLPDLSACLEILCTWTNRPSFLPVPRTAH